MSAVETALPLIKQFEGYAKRLVNDWCIAYQDVVGVWTLGYGATGPAIKQGVYWSREQADADVLGRVQALAGQITVASPVLAAPENENRLAAVISFAYNLGIGAYKASTLKRKVDARDWQAAGDEFGKWVLAGGKRVPGLVTRRATERALFLGEPISPAQPEDPSISDSQLPASADARLATRVNAIFDWLISWLRARQ